MRLSQVVMAGVAATALMLASAPVLADANPGASNGAATGQQVRRGGLNEKRSGGLVLGVLGAVGGAAALVALSGGSKGSPVSP